MILKDIKYGRKIKLGLFLAKLLTFVPFLWGSNEFLISIFKILNLRMENQISDFGPVVEIDFHSQEEYSEFSLTVLVY